MTENLLVNEIFGPTLQGEGPLAGTPAMFVRLAGCDLACTWCDTAYAWDWTGRVGPPQDRAAESHHRSVSDVLDEVIQRRGQAQLVVLSGGEPLLQHRAASRLAVDLVAEGLIVQVETNGRHTPLPDPVLHVVSPKLSSAGGPTRRRHRLPALHALSARASTTFKFVADGVADLDEVDELVAELDLAPKRVWIMPQGRSAAAVTDGGRCLVDGVVARGWNLSLRLHVLLWNDERGR